MGGGKVKDQRKEIPTVAAPLLIYRRGPPPVKVAPAMSVDNVDISMVDNESVQLEGERTNAAAACFRPTDVVANVFSHHTTVGAEVLRTAEISVSDDFTSPAIITICYLLLYIGN